MQHATTPAPLGLVAAAPHSGVEVSKANDWPGAMPSRLAVSSWTPSRVIVNSSPGVPVARRQSADSPRTITGAATPNVAADAGAGISRAAASSPRTKRVI